MKKSKLKEKLELEKFKNKALNKLVKEYFNDLVTLNQDYHSPEALEVRKKILWLDTFKKDIEYSVTFGNHSIILE